VKEHKKWPLYKAIISWIENGEHNPDYPHRNKDLPKGRIHNSMCPTYLLREGENIDRIMRDKWNKYRDAHPQKNPSGVHIETEYLFESAWALRWFSHWTWDVGQTDEEALDSFAEYVAFVQDYNNQNRKYTEGGCGYDPICLMGAEDRWRWRGRVNGDKNAPRDEDNNYKQTDPPCHCDVCQAQGMITIDH